MAGLTRMVRDALLVLMLTILLLPGCGGGGGNDRAQAEPPPAEPPADPPEEDPPEEAPPEAPPTAVAGSWEPLYTDEAADSEGSTLSGCSGDLAGEEGAAALSGGLACDTEEPIRVVQEGASFEITPMTCLGDAGASSSGAGTVNGSTLAGRFDVTSPDETQSVLFEGEVVDERIRLASIRIELSGARVGACDITPPTTSVVVLASSAGPADE